MTSDIKYKFVKRTRIIGIIIFLRIKFIIYEQTLLFAAFDIRDGIMYK